MAIFFPFHFSSGPEYTEAEIIRALCSGEEDKIRAMTHWLQERFFHVWKKCVRSNWDYDIAWRAFDNALITFVRQVQEGAYSPDNWKGYCREIAQKRYWQLFNRQKRPSPLEDTGLPEPIQEDDPGRFDLLLPLFDRMPWSRSDYHIRTIVEWWSEGYSWQEIREKLKAISGVDLSEATLRQQFSRVVFEVQVELVRRDWSWVASFRFCYSFCQSFVALRLQDTRADKIRREHPEVAAALLQQSDKADFSPAAESQFITCINCLIKQVAR